ncbi:putative duf636 domain protein [Phaeoacremonium minimum UCRPA7]|uniref:Putative duf636 domain protein n=1 Tax=Phaeoacremonium minimum (strain UCR-PA7) TaxID=1286976 RepID=R8BM49_PHAM7|nr:putative duf636 domain protein [Phaeoacremonium minimum UCRPA7]EOO00451.1 putative duf636 domain protein [Phaeoacremonium minimum UCRPA7]
MTDSHSDASTRTLRAGCYCKAIRYAVTLPTASLPLGVHLCHCSVCRYTHGTLCIFHAELPRGVIPEFIAPSSRDNLTGYTHASAKSERLFCSTCGCHIGDVGLDGEDEGEWVIATSLFDENDEDLFQIKTHCFTRSAPGGGLFEWLPRIGDREVKVWNPGPDSVMWPGSSAEEAPPKQEFDASGNEVLRAECHCGGVSFTIPRPTVSAATEDPYVAGFISPLDPAKWLACLDVCDDCRLVDGTHVVGWTFVPRAQIQPTMPPELAPFGTMKTFASSPGVMRGFCGVCGATVIFSCEGRKPSDDSHVVDISVGILRAPEGVKAEKWLTWRAGRLAWGSSGERYDSPFTTSLGDGFKRWAMEHYGEAPTFEIG